VLLDEAARDRLRQRGERERRERRPGRDADRALVAAGEVPEQAALVVPAALEQGALGPLGAAGVGRVAGQAGQRAQRGA
jgi:hypothetical protein